MHKSSDKTITYFYFTNNNHNIYYTVYFYIQEIHGGAGLISRIEYLTYILEFETIHTEDLPSDWIIRDWIENLLLGRYPDIGFDIGRNPDNPIFYTLNSIDYPEANINIISVCKLMEWNFRKWIWTMDYDANHRYNATTLQLSLSA